MRRSEFLLFEDVMNLLRDEIAAAGNQAELARKRRLSRTTLNAVLRGRRKLPANLLKALGLEKITVYKRL